MAAEWMYQKALIKQRFFLVPIYFSTKQKVISHLPGKRKTLWLFCDKEFWLFDQQTVDYNSLSRASLFSHIKGISQEKQKFP